VVGLQGHLPQLTSEKRGGLPARPSSLAPVRPLAVDGLDVRYGAVLAVADVSLEVERGRIVGLLGPNGCGKTSTLRAVVGLLRPAAGRVLVNGIAQGSANARSQIAYVPDEPDGLDELATAEYLVLVRALYRAGPEYDARATALCAAFGVAPRLRVRLGALSHGFRRVVSMVAAFALARPLVVVDEATAALDPEAAIVLREALRALADRGAGVLVATQELAFAERVCDEVVLQSGGRVVARGRTEDLAPLEQTFLSAVGARADREEVRRGLDAL